MDNLDCVNLGCAIITNSFLQSAKLNNINLSGAYIEQSDLRNVELTGVIVTNTTKLVGTRIDTDYMLKVANIKPDHLTDVMNNLKKNIHILKLNQEKYQVSENEKTTV